MNELLRQKHRVRSSAKVLRRILFIQWMILFKNRNRLHIQWLCTKAADAIFNTHKSLFFSFVRLFKQCFIRRKHFFVRLFTLFYRNLFQLTLFRSCFSFNHVTRCSFSGSFPSRTSFNNIRRILLNIHMVVAYGRRTTTLYKLLALHWLLNKKRDARTDSLHLFYTNS